MSKNKKRFIAQVIPEKEWRKLGCSLRQAWNYMWMNCDAAGVYCIDPDKYEFDNGGDVFPLEKIKEKIAAYLEFFEDKILIKSFIEINFGNKLNPEYNPHKPLFKAILENGLKLNSSLNQAYFKLIDKDKDRDKDKEEDKDKDKKGGMGEKTKRIFTKKAEGLNVVSETLQTISEIQESFKTENSWKEFICRNIREVKQGFTMQDVDDWLETFFKTIKGDGEQYKTIADTKKHFNRWLLIQIKNQKTNEPEHTINRQTKQTIERNLNGW